MTDNKAADVLRASIAAGLANDWDAVAATMAPDVVRYNRRTLGGEVTRGRDDLVESGRLMLQAGVGISEMSFDVLAVHGERLVLTRTWGRSPNGFMLEYLQITALDEADRMVEILDIDAERDARGEIEARSEG